MANFVALACARRWCGLRQGVDVDDAGLSGLPPIHVFGSGYIHPSDVKALGMLGIGRAQVHKLARDGVGLLDVEALEAALAELDGAPSIVIGSAGEVNAGDFDPSATMADLAGVTARGSTSMERSDSSPLCRNGPGISSRASTAPTP
jgi:glutamate/tyrosine decarboxylase-like PLP-dependent enzyme